MVFHHTHDPDKIVPDSSRHVFRSNTLTVDCLFSEDEGLLTCNMNTDAKKKIVQCFKCQVLYYLFFLLSSLKCVNMNYALFESFRPSVSAVLS